ncbi:2190_t:CDS:1 [Scutellospora calospora]|uniref:2190_t:CDS:1 n=1 Tax=Scutellospora calospora TaxID=85575 RepID=A0ACA9MD04_9GLOM|nr:2190_t:CDS:1 [Scutellospora calospora]
MSILNFPNEILVDIFIHVRILINVIFVCKDFKIIIVDPSFKIKWLSYHNLTSRNHTFFDTETIETIKIKFTKEFITRLAMNLHITNSLENRKKAFEIFNEINCNLWLGYYYQHGFQFVEIDENKALKYYHMASIEDQSEKDILQEALLRKTILMMRNEKKVIGDKIVDIDKDDKIQIMNTFKEIAEFGNIEASFIYGTILISGKLDNEIDLLEGHNYIFYAALNGHKNAKTFLNKMYDDITDLFNNHTHVIYSVNN